MQARITTDRHTESIIRPLRDRRRRQADSIPDEAPSPDAR